MDFEKLLEALPVLLLATGQLMQAVAIMDLSQRLKKMENLRYEQWRYEVEDEYAEG